MPSPEALYHHIVIRDSHHIHPILQIPVAWASLGSRVESDFLRLDQSITSTGSGSIVYADLKDLSPHLFDDSSVLENTVSTLAPGARPENIKIWEIQAGMKAYILMSEVDTDQGNKFFVTYLSKDPEHSDLAREAEADFANLQMLADRFGSLSPEGRGKYDVVRPISYGLSPAYNGYRYPFFTMPFLEDFGELRVDLTGVSEDSAIVPYFRYAYPLDRSMEVESERQFRHGPEKIISWLKHNQRRYGDPRKLWEDLNNTEGARHIHRQRLDLLVGNALIHIATGGYFPREFKINAGDWMAQFPREGGLNLTLVTVRGGFDYLGDYDRWVDRMTHLTEPYYPNDESNTDETFSLFYGISQNEFREAYEKAEELL